MIIPSQVFLTIALFILPSVAEAQSKLISPPQAPPSTAPSQPPSPNAAGESDRAHPQKPAADSQQPSAADQRGSMESPLIVNIPKNEAETREAGEERKNRSAADWWMVRFTAVLGFIGFLQFLALVGQGLVFWIQAKRLSQSIDLTRKIADLQGNDTRQMIETETFTLNTIKYIAERGLRPYVTFDFDLSSIIVDTDHLEYRMFAKNQGHTPAYEVRINGGINHNNPRLLKPPEFITTTEIFLPVMYAGEKHEMRIVSDKNRPKKKLNGCCRAGILGSTFMERFHSEMFSKTQVTLRDIAVFV
jgi:hypothetical protein